jgi:hypothetical protein
MSSPPVRRSAAALITSVGADLDATHVADSVVSVLRGIEDALTPIIGVRGVAALYARTLFLVSQDFTWLSITPPSVNDPMDLQLLHARVAAQSPADSVASSRAIIDTFHELLAGMIGLGLTERLLRTVLDPPSSGNAAQDATTP